MASVSVRVESKRGCGYRKPGGLYLVAPGTGRHCGKFPIPLVCCPTCSQGIKPARGWTWIDPRPIVSAAPCDGGTGLRVEVGCATCPAATGEFGEKAGLLWVGEKFYPTPGQFMSESVEMGVSRRITAVPRGFEVGTTWVLLAHRKAVTSRCQNCNGTGCDGCENGTVYAPGIFQAFKPSAVEYIVRGDETEEELDRLEARGISLVDVQTPERPNGAQPTLFDSVDVDEPDESMDGDHNSAMASAGFGTDEDYGYMGDEEAPF